MDNSAARNLNPTPEARLAMFKWGDRYSKQNGGSMDFWDSLRPAEQDLCKEQVDLILEANRTHGRLKQPRPAFSSQPAE